MSGSRRIIGRWRITEMDNWDQEAVDLVGPGFIEFDGDGLGELGFIAVTGELDCRDADREGRPGVEFSWQGSDEGDDVSGRGWAALDPDGTLEGHIYFHLGDDSAFRAVRFNLDGIAHRGTEQLKKRCGGTLELLHGVVQPVAWHGGAVRRPVDRRERGGHDCAEVPMSTGALMSSIIVYVRKPSDAAPRSPDPPVTDDTAWPHGRPGPLGWRLVRRPRGRVGGPVAW